MRPLTMIHPGRVIFGNGCLEQFVSELGESAFKRIFIVTFPEIMPRIPEVIGQLEHSGKKVETDLSIRFEPTIDAFQKVLARAQDFRTDCVAGIGGGSVLDVAKLVAALCTSHQSIDDIFGIGNLRTRGTHLICLPTTSGTGSEMSPNAILLDEKDKLKKGVISPFLVPDASYIDPLLTVSVPPQVTAATGIDAMSHCLEAYANTFAHPIVDLYALEGIRLVASNLERACRNGSDEEARSNLALASMYGGMCLGPVNTAAVHAIAYPLGSEFHIGHGLSIAVLMPHVMAFNLEAAPRRFAQIGLALGAKPGANDTETAQNGIQRLKELNRACGIPSSLQSMGIPAEAIDSMAESAMKITRLLNNNLRNIHIQDVRTIYIQAFEDS